MSKKRTSPAYLDSEGNPNSAEETIEAGDLIIKYLEQIDVEYVFGIPGGAIEPLYNALARSSRRGGPRPIVARHETGAAFMAEGYTRETGKLGVVCTTTGPGATNAITGVASAYANEVPMLVITAQTPLSVFGKGALQESSCTGINTLGIYQHCTRYNSLVSHLGQLERKLVTAIMAAHAQPAGPTHLTIPLDLLRSPAPDGGLPLNLSNLIGRPALFSKDTVNKLYSLVNDAKNIVLVIGGACGEAVGNILEFALLLNIPIITTPHGKGFVSPYHPLYKGVFGFAGHASAYEILKDTDLDLILAVGMSFSEWASSGWDKIILNDMLIHIDSSSDHLATSPMAKLHVQGSILHIFEELLNSFYNKKFPGTIRICGMKEKNDRKPKILGMSEKLSSKQPLPYIPHLLENPERHFTLDEELKYLNDEIPLKPQRLMRELVCLFPLNTRFLADPGNSLAWAIHYLHPLDRRITGHRSTSGGAFRSCIEYASMGWGVGAAVGTALGAEQHPVVSIVGDGSFLMSGQEITTAIAEKLTIIFVILNDAALGMVKHGQRLAGAEQIAYELPTVDFCALAKSMGADAHSIHSPGGLMALDIETICTRKGPTLLDVYIDPEEVPPMGIRMKILGTVK